MVVAIIFAFVCGAMLIAFLVRADPFRAQPSAAVVSQAYAARAKIENDAAREKLAADLAHARDLQRIERDTAQTLKDVGLVFIAGSVIFAFAGMAAGSHRAISSARLHARTIKPNKRGQFPIYLDPATGAITNPNLMTTATLQMEGAKALPPELQIEALAWVQRANIAASLSQQKTMPITAMQERKIAQSGVMPSFPQPGATAAPAYDVTAEFRVADDESGIHMHDDPEASPAAKPAAGANVVNTSHGGIPNDINSEQEFNDFISRRH